ncbi:MAG TPA: class 1 fructose-bisphosphatase [Burkholderiales bacterium]|nr:class 1 fructose-bisphosphatase [Burkholderiales bacterium]
MTEDIMLIGRTTFTQFIIEEQRRFTQATGDFTSLLNDIATACKAISSVLSKGTLAGDQNRETWDRLDSMSNHIFVCTTESQGHLAALASKKMPDAYVVPPRFPRGKYLLAFDPLDRSANIEVNVSVGSIFSVLRRPDGEGDSTEKDFLQPGSEQVCAGYAIYGPTTMLVLTTGHGVNGFTLDREVGEFIHTHENLIIPADTREFAINASNSRFWEPGVKRYVDECLAGVTGPRKADFNMRWVASPVAEVHRILLRGGLLLFPQDSKDPPRRLGLIYEANPLSFLVEQAGGMSCTGNERVLEMKPENLHQVTPIILGSKNEVERIVQYHQEAKKASIGLAWRGD